MEKYASLNAEALFKEAFARCNDLLAALADDEPVELGKKAAAQDKPQEKAVLLAMSAVELTATPNGPKTIEFTFLDGALKGKKRHGIYELSGDTLKLCYGPSDKPRPTAFASPAGSGYFNEVWTRERK